jgi:hypothetical protein
MTSCPWITATSSPGRTGTGGFQLPSSPPAQGTRASLVEGDHHSVLTRGHPSLPCPSQLRAWSSSWPPSTDRPLCSPFPEIKSLRGRLLHLHHEHRKRVDAAGGMLSSSLPSVPQHLTRPPQHSPAERAGHWQAVAGCCCCWCFCCCCRGCCCCCCCCGGGGGGGGDAVVVVAVTVSSKP